MNCPNCGSNINQGEMFCRVCGTRLNFQSIQQNSVVQPNMVQPNVVQPNVVQPNTMESNTVQPNMVQQNVVQPSMMVPNVVQPNIIESNTVDSNMVQQNVIQPNVVQSNYEQSPINMQQQSISNNIENTSQIYDNYSNDEAFINAYIGKNVDKLKNGDFSINTFFLGILYVLYRKMWLLGIIWFLASMIFSMFLPSFSVILTFAINIIVSVQFKKWYLKHVEEKVAKIKLENPNASYEQLLMICTKKGGTTIIPVILYIILYVIVFVVVFFVLFLGYADNLLNETSSGNIGDLSLSIPLIFEENGYNTDSYASYSLSDDEDYCRLTIKNTSASYYDSTSSYLKENVYYSSNDVISEISSKNINGNNWSSMSVQKSYGKTYYYVGQKNDKIYYIEFNIIDDSGVCSSSHSNIINSIKFN